MINNVLARSLRVDNGDKEEGKINHLYLRVKLSGSHIFLLKSDFIFFSWTPVLLQTTAVLKEWILNRVAVYRTSSCRKFILHYYLEKKKYWNVLQFITGKKKKKKQKKAFALPKILGSMRTQ